MRVFIFLTLTIGSWMFVKSDTFNAQNGFCHKCGGDFSLSTQVVDEEMNHATRILDLINARSLGLFIPV